MFEERTILLSFHSIIAQWLVGGSVEVTQKHDASGEPYPGKVEKNEKKTHLVRHFFYFYPNNLREVQLQKLFTCAF